MTEVQEVLQEEGEESELPAPAEPVSQSLQSSLYVKA